MQCQRRSWDRARGTWELCQHLGTGEVGRAMWVHWGQTAEGFWLHQCSLQTLWMQEAPGKAGCSRALFLGQKDEAKLPHTTPAPRPLVSCPSGSGSLSCASQCVELEGWWDEEMRGTSGHSLHRKKE